MRNLFGEELLRILKQVAALRRGDVEAMAKRYGLDMKDEADRLQAAEEVLAHLAQTKPESGFVKRAIAAIRAWLRENIPGFAKMKLSDGEIIENYLLPARRFVEGTAEKRKGRDWLRNMGANNTLRPQAKATLDAASVSGTDHLRNPGAFARIARTRSAHEKRIDELFNGGKANSKGVWVMDRSDVLAMLGYRSGPVTLVENKVKEGLTNHPRMTAKHWKKIPMWLDAPAMVFDSDTVPGRIVFVAPEQLKDRTPIVMIIEPAPNKDGGMKVSLLVNAYDKDSGLPLRKWVEGTKQRGSLLRYYDKEKAPYSSIVPASTWPVCRKREALRERYIGIPIWSSTITITAILYHTASQTDTGPCGRV